MKKYQPLILHTLNVEVPGIKIRQLALHRHMPETTSVKLHSHNFAQCLLYLTGQGTQQIRNQAFPVRTGTAVFLPAKTKHAFVREANRRPICLAIDFNWQTDGSKSATVKQLPLSTIHEVKQKIAAISRLQRDQQSDSSLETGARLLELMALLLNGLELTQSQNASHSSPILRRVEKLLASPESSNLPLGELARLAGYQRDYLNRQLKEHAGLTLGQFRARKLAEKAQQMLRQENSVATVASALSFDDPNYFSRWFRKQTGASPVRWRLDSDS